MKCSVLFGVENIFARQRNVNMWCSKMGSQNVRKVYPDFGEMLFHFKTKYLKPCSGFKPIAYKDEFFTEVCKKLSHGGTTANLYKIVRDGLIAKLLAYGCVHLDASKHFKRFEYYSPTRWGKSASPILELLYYSFAELSNRQIWRNLKSNTIENMNYFKGVYQWTSYFCVTKSGGRIYYHIEI